MAKYILTRKLTKHLNKGKKLNLVKFTAGGTAFHNKVVKAKVLGSTNKSSRKGAAFKLAGWEFYDDFSVAIHFYTDQNGNSIAEVISEEGFALPADCTSLFKNLYADSIDFSNIDSSCMTNATQMFQGAKFHTLDLSGLNFSHVTNMSSMFNVCHAKKIDLTKINTAQATILHSMFSGCVCPELDLSCFDFSACEDMHDMFLNCIINTVDLRNMEIKNSKTVDVTRLFSCAKIKNIILTNVDLRDFVRDGDNSDVYVDDLFNIFHNVRFKTNGMFYGCQSEKVLIDSYLFDDRKLMSRLFYGSLIDLIDSE